MNFQLYKETNPEFSALQQVLYNRGIEIEDQKKWLNAGWNEINDWTALGVDLMKEACKKVFDVIKFDGDILVVVD